MNTSPEKISREYTASLEKKVAKLEAEWLEEHRIVKILIAAGFVDQSKADQAREIVRRTQT